MNEQRYAIQALDHFLDELLQDPDIPAPVNLDADMAACARKLVLAEQSQVNPAQISEAQARVWTRVLTNAQTPGRAVSLRGVLRFFAEPASSAIQGRRRMIGPRAWLRAGLVAACVLVIAGLGLYLWAGQPPTVNAQQIMAKARAMINSPASGGVTSFSLVEIRRAALDPRMRAESGLKGDEQIVSERKLWFQAPNRWRSEYRETVVASDGKETNRYTSIAVSDGTDRWDYDPARNNVTIHRLDPSMTGKDSVSPFGQDVNNLNDLFEQASTCFDAKVTGRASVAGRAAYVVDLGPNKCPPASAPELAGRLVLWVDQETFFVLKQEQHAAADDKVIETREVTQIQYNIALDPALFTFTPPAGATIMDNRPKPAPTADEFRRQLAQLAAQVEFPVFAPGDLPPGLAPRQPKIDRTLDPAGSVEISYFPTDQPDKDSPASMMKGLTIQELRATNSLIARWTENAEPIAIGGNKGWLRRGIRNADNTGSNSAALVLRDGVLISVSSFTIAPEELVKIAAALQPVPGAHAPLPNPVAPSLAELRRRLMFPIFVPAAVPPGLTAEPPTGGELPGENITLKYHTADGAVALTVTNGAPDCCPGLDMMEKMAKTETVTLANGIAAKIADMGSAAGGWYVWFEQENRRIALNSPMLTRDQLLRVAASMSKTAELGKVEEPGARPTPTLPPLKFSVLRPTWLPETMTVREQQEGETMVLAFDPRPNDPPHDVLTLREMPKAILSPGGQPDPQETHEQIGGQAVTVVRRGQNCITLTWSVGDLQLMLTNAYDPPGHPRYTCDQLYKIMGSVR